MLNTIVLMEVLGLCVLGKPYNVGLVGLLSISLFQDLLSFSNLSAVLFNVCASVSLFSRKFYNHLRGIIIFQYG